MVEPLLSGIVLGLIPITLAGLFVAAYMQYRRGNQLDLRSEEHTSELQSRPHSSYAVFCLKKKNLTGLHHTVAS